MKRHPVNVPDSQLRLLQALRDAAIYPHPARRVSVIETHISWVLLAGRYAYKIKKALDLGFIDATALQTRRHFCEEEIRLNRRLAPQLYLDVIAIGGTPDRPQFNGSAAIEYAVRMRRFSTARQMDRLLLKGLVTPAHIDRLAATLARFHGSLPPAPDAATFGRPSDVHAPMAQNFEQLAPMLGPAQSALLARLRDASEREFSACEALIAERRRQGWVRECHGDLHLGNIVLLRDDPTPFDGIDFNPELRWIDVMNEVAFMVMDLLHRGRPDLAFRFLSGYLETTGDYAGVGVLRFYLAYRAIVRAKVAAIRAGQASIKARAAVLAETECRNLLVLADTCLALGRPALVILHGLPGCGKTTVAQLALESLHAIRIRSDVERKRIFGLAPLASSGASIDDGIYSREATQRTYGKLLHLAKTLLATGWNVIVDAAFLKASERAEFRQLAAEMATPFTVLHVQAEADRLRQRIVERQAHARDASEADLDVLEKLTQALEPLQPAEMADAVILHNSGSLERLARQWADCGLRERLGKHRL